MWVISFYNIFFLTKQNHYRIPYETDVNVQRMSMYGDTGQVFVDTSTYTMFKAPDIINNKLNDTPNWPGAN